MWAKEGRRESLKTLRQFASELQSDIVHHSSKNHINMVDIREKELPNLLARCFFKIAEWQVALEPDWASVRWILPDNLLQNC